MTNQLDELFRLSRQWIKHKRLSHVARDAMAFIRERFQVEAGFISYARPPRKDGVEYLRFTNRWFSSFGFPVPDDVIRRAVTETMDFQSEILRRPWFDVDEVPAAWAAINEASGIHEVGLWLVNFEDEVVGIFALGRKSRDDEENRVLSQCMAHIVVVLEMVLTRRFAEEVGVRDPLTGLFNRRGFLKEFDRVVAESIGPLTLAVLDIDAFKSINDRFGHQRGDEVLVKVGDVLKRHAEAYQGISARIGGDEFLLLGHIGVKDVYRAATTVSGWFAEDGLNVSVTAGCSVLGKDGSNFDIAYHVADRRLYQTKHNRDSHIG